jgi:hypothetical protein
MSYRCRSVTGLLNWSCTTYNNIHAYLFPTHSCYMSCLYRPPQLDHSNYTECGKLTSFVI